MEATRQGIASDSDDARWGEGGPAAWIGSIGRRLSRHAQDGRPFAVLLVELDDADRLRGVEIDGDVSAAVDRAEEALSRLLRPADSLNRESFGRYWIVTPDTDALAVQALAERMASEVEASASHRGAALRVAIGIAVCPDDGTDSASLAARADMGLFAARAAGRTVMRSPQ